MEQVLEVGKAFFNFKIYKFGNEYFKFGINISSLKYILPVQIRIYLMFSEYCPDNIFKNTIYGIVDTFRSHEIPFTTRI